MTRSLLKIFTVLIAVSSLLSIGACTAPGDAAETTADRPTLSVEASVAAPAPADSGADEAAAPVELSLEALGDGTYQGVLDQTVTLADGRFEGEPAEAGATSRPVVTLLPEPRVYGDLDGDGRPDSAVLLAAESGGSGTFVYMAVVAVEDGRPVNLATTQLGDRVQVKELRLEEGQIAVTLLTQGPEDPMCCPTQEETRVYRVEGGQLVQVDGDG